MSEVGMRALVRVLVAQRICAFDAPADGDLDPTELARTPHEVGGIAIDAENLGYRFEIEVFSHVLESRRRARKASEVVHRACLDMAATGRVPY